MSYILNIHTATETAIINIIKDGEILGTFTNNDTKQHASFLHTGIRELLQMHAVDIKELGAVGVSAGPGSYTGIRVGLSTAKGLCYALNIPLITFNSLELMALSAIAATGDAEALYCPMIDARRMEVYTALYDYNLLEIASPSAMIVDENSFEDVLRSKKIYFSGSGIDKLRPIIKNINSVFINCPISSESISSVSWRKYLKKDFENIPYAQPLYIKDFYTISKT